MIVSLNWLKKYVDLTAAPEEISEVLTSLGFEVEEFETQGGDINNVVVAKVLSKGKHPDADKLSVCEVTDGKENFPVVCGAPNVAEGQLILFAKVGAKLPGDFKIKKSKIRGQESQGMICAEDELGLSNDHSGIKVLPENTPMGIGLTEVPGLCDSIFDIAITPNRPDGLSHIGIARELAAFYQKEIKLPKIENQIPVATKKSDGFSLEVIADEDCPMYTGRIIKNVKVGPSPEWLANALDKIGQKSINNVVDLTNYVLQEYGHPSHAFDMGKLQGNKVEIRFANQGEKLTLLDETELELSEEDLLIADAKDPKCLAGVMGGLDSGVTESTQDIFLEVAYFKPQTIRRISKKRGISSDSSYRFERGTDPLNLSWVSQYLTEQICKLTGGTAGNDLLVDQSKIHPTQSHIIELRTTRTNHVLGTTLSQNEIRDLLISIELKSSVKDENILQVEIPGFRIDLDREIDLIEEVARLFNYNNIPTHLPEFPLSPVSLPWKEIRNRKIRNSLVEQGLFDCLSLRFLSHNDLDNFQSPEGSDYKKTVALKNPLNSEWQVMPTTLLPNLLKAVNHNQRNQEKRVRLFEIGKTFYNNEEQRDKKNPGVIERDRLSICLSGDWESNSWMADGSQSDFYVLKGIVENLFLSLNLDVSYETDNIFYLHPKESLSIKYKNDVIGHFGTLNPLVQENFELKGHTTVAEIFIDTLPQVHIGEVKFQSFGKFSMVTREMNILVNQEVTHQKILDWMPLSKVKYLKEVRLNSIYEGKELGENKKALHYSFLYQNPNKTLTDEEVNKIQEKIARELEKVPEISFK